ncbi:MAG: ABC transporter substrate-binding protein [Alphaproteobacteria bacterium]|nr:ABC transporter substrate-binding protein [Alphaproteobacteria bacterium]
MLKPIKSRFLTALTIVLLLAAAPVQTAHASGASAVIERLHASLLDVMKNADALGFTGRYKQLYPTIKSAFDHPRMVISMVSVTRWRKFTKKQQAQLLEAFRNFSVAEYANRFDGWSGESFRVVDEIKARRGSVLVSTLIGRGNKDDVNLRYVMHKTKSGKWRIIDVLYQGSTSEVARRRAEYQSVIRRQGVDALVNTLNQKVEQLASSEQARVAQKPR